MNIVELKEFFVDLDSIKYVKKLPNHTIYINFGKDSGLQLTGKEAEDFVSLLRKKGKTLDRALASN